VFSGLFQYIQEIGPGQGFPAAEGDIKRAIIEKLLQYPADFVYGKLIRLWSADTGFDIAMRTLEITFMSYLDVYIAGDYLAGQSSSGLPKCDILWLRFYSG
jgi:hypothetical protein